MIGGTLNVQSSGNPVPFSTFTNGDNIQATGLNNTFNLSATSDANIPSVNAQVSGVQNARVTASGAIIFDGTGAQGWTGLTSLTTNSNNGGTLDGVQLITVAPTTNVNSTLSRATSSDVTVNGGQNVAINVTGQSGTSGANSAILVNSPTGSVNVNATVVSSASSANNFQGNITINGGTTVVVNTNTTTLSPTTTTTQGNIFVNRELNTTSVAVNQRAALAGATAVDTGLVRIADFNFGTSDADSISTATLSNYGTVGGNESSVNSAALTNLNLSGDFPLSTNLNINNQVAPANQTASTLNLNLASFFNLGEINLTRDGGSGSTSYTTVNLQSSSSGAVLGGLVTNGGSSSAITSLNISGVAGLDLQTYAALTSNGTITSTNSGGVRLGVTLGVNQGFNGALSSGGDNIGVDNTTRNINVGNGNNNVTFTSPVITTGSVTAGTGIDTASFAANTAETATATSAFATKISGFDKLRLETSTSTPSVIRVINLANLDNISNIINAGITPVDLNNFANNGTVTSRFLGSVTSNNQVVNLASTSGTSDILNYGIEADNVSTAGLTADGVETINISNLDFGAPSSANTLTVGANAVQTFAITGNSGLELINTNTTVTNLNASALSGSFKWTTTGALTGPSTIIGSATADNEISLSGITSSSASVTYTGGSGRNNITTGAANDTINGGINADTLSGGAGQDVINSGGDTNPSFADSITGGAGADIISIVGSPDAFINNNAVNSSGINSATGSATSVIATVFDRITGTTNGVKLALPSTPTFANSDLVFGAQSLAGADGKVNFATGTFANGTFTFNPNGSDTLVTYDNSGSSCGVFESVVLTGFIPGALTSVSSNVLTLSSLNA